jgi:hypothetical protein
LKQDTLTGVSLPVFIRSSSVKRLFFIAPQEKDLATLGEALFPIFYHLRLEF